MIKLTDLLDKSEQTGHISKHNPATAFAPVQEGPADDDAKAARIMKNDLEDVYDHIYNSLIKIEGKLSDFNSPGLKHAFIDGIKAGIARQGKFDYRAARAKLARYFSK
jgi:hypothetical protein